jgi:hypothetical protein
MAVKSAIGRTYCIVIIMHIPQKARRGSNFIVRLTYVNIVVAMNGYRFHFTVNIMMNAMAVTVNNHHGDLSDHHDGHSDLSHHDKMSKAGQSRRRQCRLDGILFVHVMTQTFSQGKQAHMWSLR